MGFTEKKFSKLSKNNKLKKIVFAIRQYLDNKQELNYLISLVQWFNHYENLSLPMPQSHSDWGILAHSFLQELNQFDPFCEEIPYDHPKKEKKILPVKVILDHIRSPFNVGSIIRSCEAMGVEEIYLTGITPGIENAKVAKTAKNAVVSVQRRSDAIQLLQELKSKHFTIISLEKTRHSLEIVSLNQRKKSALILGNEEFGVSTSILEISDFIVHIPMNGVKNSLNVSVAAGIVLFQLAQLFQ